jgi:hypothetical protein
MNTSVASGLGKVRSAGANHQVTQLPDEDGASGFTTAPAVSFAAAEVGLRHLKTPGEIERILHLRDAIDLSAHGAARPEFRALEKKETSAASSAPLN